MQKAIGGHSTPVRSYPPKILSSNVTCVIVSRRLPTTQILVSINRVVVASVQIGKIQPLCDFVTFLTIPFCAFFCSFAQVEPLNRFSRFMAQRMCFRTIRCRLGIRMKEIRAQNPERLKSGRAYAISSQKK